MKNARRLLVPAVLLLGLAAGCRRPAAEAPAPPAAPQHLTDGEESCVDAWLADRKLDPYGHAEGTMYTGGTPLFDERTGERTDRLAYVFGRHPQAREACAPGSPPPARLPEQ